MKQHGARAKLRKNNEFGMSISWRLVTCQEMSGSHCLLLEPGVGRVEAYLMAGGSMTLMRLLMTQALTRSVLNVDAHEMAAGGGRSCVAQHVFCSYLSNRG